MKHQPDFFAATILVAIVVLSSSADAQNYGLGTCRDEVRL